MNNFVANDDSLGVKNLVKLKNRKPQTAAILQTKSIAISNDIIADKNDNSSRENKRRKYHPSNDSITT